jgi:hypothetical protein
LTRIGRATGVYRVTVGEHLGAAGFPPRTGSARQKCPRLTTAELVEQALPEEYFVRLLLSWDAAFLR